MDENTIFPAWYDIEMNAQEKILIVDDEPDTILILQDRLEMDGYEVATATDGRDALELIDQDLPDLVLLDIQMPRSKWMATRLQLLPMGAMPSS